MAGDSCHIAILWEKVYILLLFQGNGNIYSDLENNPQRARQTESLLEMAQKKFFGEEELLTEISKYLKSIKSQKNYTNKVSW